MAILVWFTTGVALWHFTVFLPDRWWAGIVGAFIGASLGAVLTGAIGQIVTGDSIGNTGIETVLFAIPGTALGLALIYSIGVRQEADRLAPPSCAPPPDPAEAPRRSELQNTLVAALQGGRCRPGRFLAWKRAGKCRQVVHARALRLRRGPCADGRARPGRADRGHA